MYTTALPALPNFDARFAEKKFGKMSHAFGKVGFGKMGFGKKGIYPPQPLGAAYIPILLSEVEQEQRLGAYGDREASEVGARVATGHLI